LRLSTIGNVEKEFSMGVIYKLTIPKLGLTMEEGTLVKWLVDEGAEIAQGAEVAEVETDKLSNAVESAQPGILRRKVANEGDLLPVGALIGVVADASVSDEEIDAFIASNIGMPASAEGEAEEAPSPERNAPVIPAGMEGDKVEPLSSTRAAIAKAVSSSWSTIPHIFVNVKIDMGKAESKYRALKDTGSKISMNDLLIKAISLAVPAFPLVNASFADGSVVLHHDVNISMAVGLDKGVILPVIGKCQGLSLQEIGAKSRELVGKANAGELTEEDLVGGTIGVSNMGMLGTEAFTAIVPPNHAAILAVGMVQSVPVVRDGKIVAARVMQVTMSVDHRVLDGAYAAKFLGQLKITLEEADALFD
jgi:pyruvate dehydrogenase E2 component (dihydrolipoamide acetyltransferase)